MVSVLVIGYAPEAVDFTDPAIPHELNKEVLVKGIDEDMRQFRARGWQADHLPIYPNDQLRQSILNQLHDHKYDCIVIGGGVRLTNKHVPELECVVSAIREGAPNTPIAFNERPDKSSEAAARVLKI